MFFKSRTSENSWPGEIIVEAFGRSDVGLAREHNEDSFAFAHLDAEDPTPPESLVRRPLSANGAVFMVADGMGGAAAGELASAMAVDAVIGELLRQPPPASSGNGRDFAKALRTATENANRSIFEFAAANPEHRGMGTTATIAGLHGDTLYLSQVGDSRAYLIRGEMAIQLTKDQSLTQRLVEAGELTEEEAQLSERRNIILQALGPEENVRADLTTQTIRRNDLLILCSDGLTGVVRQQDIVRIAQDTVELPELCTRLIDLANERGGPDNITVVAARFTGSALQEPAGEDYVGYSAFSVTPQEIRTVEAGPVSTTASPGDREGESGTAGSGASEENLARNVLYGVLIATLVGVAWLLYQRFTGGEP